MGVFLTGPARPSSRFRYRETGSGRFCSLVRATLGSLLTQQDHHIVSGCSPHSSLIPDLPSHPVHRTPPPRVASVIESD